MYFSHYLLLDESYQITGYKKKWNVGMMEYWNVGVGRLGEWGDGVLVYWGDGMAFNQKFLRMLFSGQGIKNY
jgi:hypothetical protein